MQAKLTVYNLYESRHVSSKIIYYDGIKKHSVTFGDFDKTVCLISELFYDLRLSESFICCLIKTSLSLPALILGILKVSSTFAFLDVHKPTEKLQAFQKYLEVKFLIVEECYLRNLKTGLCSCWKKLSHFHSYSDFTILQSTKCEKDACGNSKECNKCDRQTEIAYAIQTSGTTGEPKVVQVPHECIISNIIDLRTRFSVTSEDVIIQSTRITFDPSMIEIFLSLSSGATLVLIADHFRTIPKKLIEIIVNENVTIFQGTPSFICNFGDDVLKGILLKNESVLRILAFGGESCPSMNKLKRWKSEGNKTEIYNLYGLTELSCWASCYKVDFDSICSMPSLPIGEPLLNTKFEVRNENGEVVNEGELYIGGCKRFCIINDENFPENPEHFMRATGDFVYRTNDGLIYFEGRNDSIIKYMGHKISMQLVNNVVENFFDVLNHLLYYDSCSTRIYLFVVWTSKNICEDEIKLKLLKSLTDAISSLPAVVIIPVAFIPLTKHGKVDIKKLIDLVNTTMKKRKLTERVIDETYDNIISTLWKSFTNQTNISENDSFILKGGDSISAVQFAAEIEWKVQLLLPLLVEKLLNESFKDVKMYVKTCLKENSKSFEFYENFSTSSDFINQPFFKRKCYTDSQCFRVASKQGSMKFCKHAQDSDSCLCENSYNSQNRVLHLSLAFTWDLKKCIDATPCILYLPHTSELMIFIGSHFGIFSCIDVNQRSEKWKILVPDRVESSACISACGNYVLFGCYDHNLYCISIKSGNIHWKYETGAEVKSSPSISLNNNVFVGSHDKHVYAFDIQSGLLLWKKQVAFGSIFSSPAIIETINAVCVSTLDGILALIQMTSGNILWKYNSGKPFFSSPLVTPKFIAVGSTDKCLLCVDFDGNEKFIYHTEEPVFSSAVYHKDIEGQLLFGCHDSYVYCITSDGNLSWKTLCDSAVYATPFTFKFNSDYYVCVASSKGTIYILQLIDGKVIFFWKCHGEIFSSPILLNDILVIGCRDNNIYCFNLTNCIEKDQ